MIDAELRAEIRRLFHAEHWRIGTIARQLGLHRDTVRRALRTERFNRDKIRRPRLTDPYVEFMRETLQRYPTLRATRLFEMIRQRGYQGSVIQVRRLAAELRPQPREAFLRLRAFPAEQGQVDWACFGTVAVGRAKRRLSCLVLTLSHSRALSLEFFFDQSLESFLRGHVRAFAQWGGCPRTLLYDYVAGHIIVLMCPSRLCAGVTRRAVFAGRTAHSWEHNDQRESSQASKASSSFQTAFRGSAGETSKGGSQSRRAASLMRTVI